MIIPTATPSADSGAGPGGGRPSRCLPLPKLERYHLGRQDAINPFPGVRAQGPAQRFPFVYEISVSPSSSKSICLCSFVRAIQYAFTFCMILFRSRVSHSQNSLAGPWGRHAYPCVDERACRFDFGSRYNSCLLKIQYAASARCRPTATVALPCIFVLCLTRTYNCAT